MNTDELAVMLLGQLDAMRRSLDDDHPEVVPIPSLVVQGARNVEIIALADWDDTNKRSAMYALGRKYGRDVEAIYFMADAWAADVEREEGLRRVREGGPPVKDMPGAVEALVGVAMTPAGQTVGVEQRYTRGPNRERVYEEPKRTDQKAGFELSRAFVLEPFWRGAAIWSR